jgi:hypothetical protein
MRLRPSALALILALATCSNVVAQDSLNVSRLGSFNLNWGWGADVVKSGNYIYVADLNTGLQIVNVSNPGFPTQAGQYRDLGGLSGLVGSGNRLYSTHLTAGLVSLFVLDITDPVHPTLVGSLEGVSDGQLRLAEPYLFIGGLQVIDVSNPVAPAVAATISLGAVGVAVEGTFAYVAGDGRLVVLDVSTASQPDSLGSCPIASDHIMSVTARGNCAYVACRDDGLVVVDVSNPSSPLVVGSCLTRDWAMKIVLDGDYAYVADDVAGLSIVDISIPAAPMLLGGYRTTAWAEGITFVEPYVYLSAGWDLLILDPRTPMAPILVGQVGRREIRSLTSSGNYVWAASPGLITTLDFSNPAHPTEIARSEFEGEPDWLCVSNGHLFASTYGSTHGELIAMNVTNPASPTVDTVLALPYEIEGMKVEGDYLYYVCPGENFAHNLVVLDVSDPASPVVAGTCVVASWYQDMAVSGGFVYLLTSNLEIFDATVPAAVHRVLQDLANDGCYIAVEGSMMVIRSCSHDTLAIYDMGDRSAPLLTAAIANDGDGNIAMTNSYLYCSARRDSTLEILNLRSPAEPALAGYYRPEGWYNAFSKIAVRDDTLCAWYGNDVRVLRFQASGSTDIRTALTNDFNLTSAYPNPFNGMTRISFNLPAANRINLSVFDVLGRRVRTVAEGWFQAGNHGVVFDAGPLPSGTYLITLSTKERHAVQKLVLIR